MVSVWVQYASDDGLVTASDLISMIHNWLLDSGCGCVDIEGSALLLSRGCCTNHTSFKVNMNLTRNNGSDEKPAASKDSLFSYGTQVVVGTVGGFVGGILLTICLGACVILR